MISCDFLAVPSSNLNSVASNLSLLETQTTQLALARAQLFAFVLFAFCMGFCCVFSLNLLFYCLDVSMDPFLLIC